MQRISLRVFLILAFALGLPPQSNYGWAANTSKFDKKLIRSRYAQGGLSVQHTPRHGDIPGI